MRESIGRYHDKKKKDVPKYNISDLIMLNCNNLKMHQPGKKYDHKILGPFRIDKTIFPMVVRLQLLESWTVYLVFYIKLLELFRVQQGALRPNLQEILLEMEDLVQPLNEVKEIMDSHWDKDQEKILYMVQ
jgi:hypothetical protein